MKPPRFALSKIGSRFEIQNQSPGLLQDQRPLRLPRLHKAKSKASSHSAKPGFRKDLLKHSKVLEEVHSKYYAKAVIKSSIENLQKFIPAEDLKTEVKDLTANTKKFYRTSKREQFRRRHSTAPLVIVGFEGVVGDVFKPNLWAAGALKLYLRRGSIKCLKLLKHHCQLVLFIHSSRPNTSKLLEFFERKGLVFDGVYRSTSKKDKNTLRKSQYIQDYSQVEIDFEIQDKNVLILTSIELSNEELASNSGEENIFHTSHYKPKYLIKGVPTYNNSKPLPDTMIVPDPRASDMQAFNFSVIYKHVIEWIEDKSQPSPFVEIFESSFYQYSLVREAVSVNNKQFYQYSNQNNSRHTHCVCPEDARHKCYFNIYEQCLTEKQLMAYYVAGKNVPNSFSFNKFIILKHPVTSTYRMIHDHLPVEKPFLLAFKKM